MNLESFETYLRIVILSLVAAILLYIAAYHAVYNITQFLYTNA